MPSEDSTVIFKQTYQLKAWLDETHREGPYFVGGNTVKRNNVLLQGLDEILTKYESN
jgi:hypothetical protein